MLGTSVAAVKSRLQRARASLADVARVPEDTVEPNVEALTAVLRADATLELVPARSWYAGKGACSRTVTTAVGDPGDWRMARTVANGQPAVAAYLHGQPFGVAVLDARRNGIAGITVFGDPVLVERFTLVERR